MIVLLLEHWFLKASILEDPGNCSSFFINTTFLGERSPVYALTIQLLTKNLSHLRGL